MNAIYTIISVLIVSLVSIAAAIPILIKKKVSQESLLFLLSMSVGVLLATVFFDLLPEAIEHDYDFSVGISILSGFLVLFILEKFIHWRHEKKCEDGDCGHSHGYHLAAVNLIGDGIHNFIDGMIIAGSYSVSVVLGLTATISIIFHEVPQEIADFGVLIYSGMSKKKALIFNFLSALTAVFGAVLGIVLIGKLEGFTEFVIPFAAGNFIYIAASNLLPQLHRHCKLWDTVMHILAVVLGIMIVILVTSFGPAHIHG